MSNDLSAVLCFSGGLDSTVLLYSLRNQGYDVYPIAVRYGQRHDREIEAALLLDPTTSVVSIEGLNLSGCLTDPSMPVPHGHYAADTMKQTVVPNRNMILLSLATAYAITLRTEIVAFAAHSGDHTIYPDCRPEFVSSLSSAIHRGNWSSPMLKAPFSDKTKTDIVKLGDRLGVPFEKTWSCYEGSDVHCGLCGTCYERKEAFQLADVTDPTEYAS